MERFLGKFSLQGLNQEENEIMNKPITSTEIGAVIKIPENQSPGPDGFTGEFYQTFREKLWYIYTMEYYSFIKKDTFKSVLLRWMKLEPIIQSEVSQKDKHQYSILMHMYGI